MNINTNNLKKIHFLFVVVIFITIDYFISVGVENRLKNQIQYTNNDYSFEKTNGFQKLKITKTKSNSIVNTKINDSTFTYLFDFENVSFGTLKIVNHNSSKFTYKVNLNELLNQKINYFNKFSVGHFNNSFEIKDSLIIQLYQRNLPRQQDLDKNIKGVIPFRYAEITTTSKLNNFKVEKINVEYPFDGKVSEFKSSDKLLNDIWELCFNTIINTSFSGIFIDGNRERKPYEADAYLSQISQLSLINDSRISYLTIDYLLKNPNSILEWSFFMIEMVKEQYLNFGDKNFLMKNYDELKNRLFLNKINSKSLLNVTDSLGNYHLKIKNKILKPIIDWPPIERKDFELRQQSFFELININFEIWYRKFRKFTFNVYNLDNLKSYHELKIDYLKNEKLKEIYPNNFVVNAYLLNAVDSMRYISMELDLKNDYIFYDDFYKNLKQSLLNNFYNQKNNFFWDTEQKKSSSFHSNLFGVLFNVAESDNKKIIKKHLISDLSKPSVFSSHFFLKMLYQNDFDDIALQYLKSQSERSWSSMINNGLTMTSEVWQEESKKDMDYSHAWGSSPIFHVIRNIVGLNPIAPFYDKIIISPKPGNLESFSSKVVTPKGVFKIEYISNNESIIYKVGYPKNFDNFEIIIEKIKFKNYDFYLNDIKKLRFKDKIIIDKINFNGFVQLKFINKS